ncbi:MAG: hypothetical protein BroJett029_18880 [Alphaproteobacteria bacterium]|nr:MAG: hypothetical protein BroJett029_18880 [Alphaproteobacteria bacterium]
MRRIWVAIAMGLTLAGVTTQLSSRASAQDEDRHEGYYYPAPQSTEIYTARVVALPGNDRARRIGFVTGMTQQLLGGRYEPSYAIFAKGDEAEKLIIVGLADGELNTIYRMRALLANLTAVSRVTQFFRENTLPEYATFFDLLKLLGFEQLTVTDGVSLTHQVLIE